MPTRKIFFSNWLKSKHNPQASPIRVDSSSFSITYVGLRCTSNQPQSDDFFGFKFVLHQHPVHDTSIRRDGVEVIILRDIRVPSHLPHWVGMLLSTNCRLVDGFLVLVSYIIHQDRSYCHYNHSTIIQADSQQSCTFRVKIETHHTGFTTVGIFWVGGVLQRVETNEAHSLLREVVTTQTHSE